MSGHAFRIGSAQRAALEIYVFDVAHDEDDQRIEGTLSAGAVTITSDLEQAWSVLTDAANNCDEAGDAELCRALTTLATRVLRAAYAARGGDDSR